MKKKIKKAKPGSAERPIDVHVADYCNEIEGWKGVRAMAKSFKLDWYDVAETLYNRFAPKTTFDSHILLADIYDLGRKLSENKISKGVIYNDKYYPRVPQRKEPEWAINILLDSSKRFRDSWSQIARTKGKKTVLKTPVEIRKAIVKYYKRRMKTEAKKIKYLAEETSLGLGLDYPQLKFVK